MLPSVGQDSGRWAPCTYNAMSIRQPEPAHMDSLALILHALKRAAQDVFNPRMFALVLWPMGLALLVWSLLAWMFGSTWREAMESLLVMTPLPGLAEWLGADWLLGSTAFFFIIVLWLPLVYATALLITSLALMPLIVKFVAERDYPGLERFHGGTWMGSVLNGLVALVLYVLAWVALLPLWLLAPFGIVVSLALNAWLNQRLFIYDAASEHADVNELSGLRKQGGWPLFGLSAFLGFLHFVPVLNLLAPVYMGLAFTHYGLGRLASVRRVQA